MAALLCLLVKLHRYRPAGSSDNRFTFQLPYIYNTSSKSKLRAAVDIRTILLLMSKQIARCGSQVQVRLYRFGRGKTYTAYVRKLSRLIILFLYNVIESQQYLATDLGKGQWLIVDRYEVYLLARPIENSCLSIYNLQSFRLPRPQSQPSPSLSTYGVQRH